MGHQVDSKNFDTQFALREARTLYASFVNLMEGSQAVALQQKVKFDANPLEKAYKDHKDSKKSCGSIPEHFAMIGGQSREQEIILQA